MLQQRQSVQNMKYPEHLAVLVAVFSFSINQAGRLWAVSCKLVTHFVKSVCPSAFNLALAEVTLPSLWPFVCFSFPNPLLQSVFNLAFYILLCSSLSLCVFTSHFFFTFYIHTYIFFFIGRPTESTSKAHFLLNAQVLNSLSFFFSTSFFSHPSGLASTTDTAKDSWQLFLICILFNYFAFFSFLFFSFNF